MLSITRSQGVIVGGFNPGGGRCGIDETLDSMVADAAEGLRTRHSKDVEIRFNSDRRSGGAFLAQSDTVGVFVARVDLDAMKSDHDDSLEDFGDACRRLSIDPRGARVQYSTRVNVDASRLRDPSIANCGGPRPYAFLPAKDVEHALAILEDVLVH